MTTKMLDPGTWAADHLQSREDKAVRAPGLHLGAIVQSMLRQLNPAKYKDSPIRPEYGDWGYVWEEVLSKGWLSKRIETGKIIRPGEQTVREDRVPGGVVYMNLDGFDVEDWCLEEWKSTWKSIKKAVGDDRPLRPELEFIGLGGEHFWHWKVQGMAYARAMRTRRCRYRVMFVNGDYQPPVPVRRAWEVEWEEKEIEENWEMIVGHAQGMKVGAGQDKF